MGSLEPLWTHFATVLERVAAGAVKCIFKFWVNSPGLEWRIVIATTLSRGTPMSKSSVRMGFSSPRGRPFRSAVPVLFGLRQSSRGAFGGAVMALVVVASLLVAVSPARADGITWTSRTSAADNDWVSVAYGNGLWVAVASSGTGNRVMTSGAMNVAGSSVALPPSVSCAPLPAVVGATITCTVTGGNAGIDILWRAAYNPVIAETGVTLDASGSGTFSFTVPAAALGEELTVELVEWTAPLSLGTVGGPVPTSVPSGEGPVPAWSLVLAVLIALGLLRRRAFGSVEG